MQWLVLIVGVLFLLFQIFVNTGGKAKFKSDLQPTEQTKKRGKIKCFLILSGICLVVFCLLLMILSLIF